jgi:tryptophan synthase alpha subunit
MASLLSQAFQNAKNENRPALLTYTVAGDNTKKKSLEILKSISNYADICELGFPQTLPLRMEAKFKPVHIEQLKMELKSMMYFQ